MYIKGTKSKYHFNCRSVVGLIAVVASASASATVWDLATDFSLTNNPNGVWSYGSRAGSAFTALPNTFSQSLFSGWFDSVAVANIGINTSGSAAFGVAAGHVSLDCDGGFPDARWTAPSTGHFDIYVQVGGTTAAEQGGYGNGGAAQAMVSINGINEGGTYDATTNLNTWSLIGVSLHAGDAIDTWLSPVGGGGNTDTTFTVSTSAVPEPSSLILGAALFGGLIARRRRR